MRKQTASSFWEKVDIKGQNDCWNWKKSKKLNGYGQLLWNYKNVYSHRTAWILSNGDIPQGLFVCHKCDNPACCNPNHLWLGTPITNVLDMMNKGRYYLNSNRAWAHGSTHYSSKFTNETIVKIRKMYEDKPNQYKWLADLFNVSSNCIYAIVTRKTWKHV